MSENAGAPCVPPYLLQPVVEVSGKMLRKVFEVPAIAVKLRIAFSSVPSFGMLSPVAQVVGVHHAGWPATRTFTVALGPIAWGFPSPRPLHALDGVPTRVSQTRIGAIGWYSPAGRLADAAVKKPSTSARTLTVPRPL